MLGLRLVASRGSELKKAFGKRRELINQTMGYTPKKKVDEDKVTERLSKQPRTQKTTRGKRRLTFEQAYGRRTTESSRQRVLELYGKKRPPKSYRGTAKFPTPIPSDQIGKSKPLQPESGPTRTYHGRKSNLASKVKNKYAKFY